LYYQARATVKGLTLLLLLVVSRFVLRKPWLAAGGHVLVVTTVFTLGLGHPETSWLAAGLSAVLVYLLLMRFGLLAVANYVLIRDLLSYPLALDLGAWHAANTTVFPLSMILVLTIYGYYASLAGRPLWRDAVFQN